MRARIDIAVDREPELLIRQLVVPLDASLRERGVGRVIRHGVDRLLLVTVDVRLTGVRAIDCILEFLVQADAPVGTIVYRRDWLGRKRDIVVLEPPDTV